MPAAVLLVAVLAAAGAGTDPRAALSGALDPEIQTRLPGEAAAAGGATSPPRPFRERKIGGATPAEPSRGEDPGFVRPAFGGVASIVAWAIVIVALGMLGVYLYRELSGRRGPSAIPDDTPPAAEAGSATDRPRADAEALARAGRFAEAIHELLLGTLRELAGRGAGAPIQRSLTSREVVARVAVPPAARAALGDLVSVVEVTHFGAAVPGPDEWEHARRRFEVVAGALRA